MNMSFPSREHVESIRKNYPLGTRVMLNNMDDPYSPGGTGEFLPGSEEPSGRVAAGVGSAAPEFKGGVCQLAPLPRRRK